MCVCVCGAGLIAGVVVLSLLGTVLLGAVVVVVVCLVVDARRLPAACPPLSRRKQSSSQSDTYEQISVRTISGVK